MKPEDFVGWTVSFHGADWSILEPGVYYCVGLRESPGDDTMLQLSRHGAARDPNSGGFVGVNWWEYPQDCTRLRQGDFAP